MSDMSFMISHYFNVAHPDGEICDGLRAGKVSLLLDERELQITLFYVERTHDHPRQIAWFRLCQQVNQQFMATTRGLNP